MKTNEALSDALDARQLLRVLAAVLRGDFTVRMPWVAVGSPSTAGDITIARTVVQGFACGFVLLSFLWSWIFGAQGALAFSMPEATFLFPAPVTRRSSGSLVEDWKDTGLVSVMP